MLLTSQHIINILQCSPFIGNYYLNTSTVVQVLNYLNLKQMIDFRVWSSVLFACNPVFYRLQSFKRLLTY